MPFEVKARSASFGELTIIAATSGEALQRSRDLQGGDESAVIAIVDLLGNEYDPDTFERIATESSFAAAHLQLVQGTCDVLLSANSRAADIFYERLFELAPETRSMFATDLSGQRAKLKDTLASLVDYLSDRFAFAGIVSKLGRRHAAYGVERAHYGPAGAALLASLAELLGPRFTPDVKAAWTALYVHVSELMIRAQEKERAATV